jgi:hypothetical protein
LKAGLRAVEKPLLGRGLGRLLMPRIIIITTLQVREIFFKVSNSTNQRMNSSKIETANPLKADWLFALPYEIQGYVRFKKRDRFN